MKKRFRTSCNESEEYPICLINPATNDYNLKLYHERLAEQSARLFCPHANADVDILEYVESSQGMLEMMP